MSAVPREGLTMPLSVFSVTVPNTTVTADRGTGRAAFSVDVKNETTVAERVVVTVRGEAADGVPAAADAWFGERQQKPLPAGTSEAFPVEAQVPQGQAPGSYGFVAVAYSADRDPAETTATGPRMTLVVPEPPPRRPPWYRRWWPWWLLAAVAAVVLTVLLVLLVRWLLDDRVEVPDVAGRTVAEAEQLLRDARLQVTGTELEGSQPRPSLATGTRPPAGRKVEEDTGVLLLISGITVPDLRGQTTAEGQQALEALGLRVVVQGEEASSLTPGTVLRTDPAAGTAVAPDRSTTLVVATASTVFLPDVRRSEPTAAVERLRALGFDVTLTGTCGGFIGSTFRCGIVGQQPASGQVPAGTAVRLFQSRIFVGTPFDDRVVLPPLEPVFPRS